MTLHRAPLPVECVYGGTEAPLPPDVPRDVPDETVKALVVCLKLTIIILAVGDNGCDRCGTRTSRSTSYRCDHVTPSELSLKLLNESLHSSCPSSWTCVHGARRDGHWHRSRRRRLAFLLPRHLPQGRPCVNIHWSMRCTCDDRIRYHRGCEEVGRCDDCGCSCCPRRACGFGRHFPAPIPLSRLIWNVIAAKNFAQPPWFCIHFPHCAFIAENNTSF